MGQDQPANPATTNTYARGAATVNTIQTMRSSAVSDATAMKEADPAQHTPPVMLSGKSHAGNFPQGQRIMGKNVATTEQQKKKPPRRRGLVASRNSSARISRV